MDTGKWKDILRDFLKSELDEIKENKFRFFALVFFAILSIGFMFMDEDMEQIELNEPLQVEEEKLVAMEDTKSSTKSIVVEKKSAEPGEPIVSVVLGANPDDIYIRDPFAVQKDVEIESESEIEETPVIVRQKPTLPPIPTTSAIPAMNPTIPDNLPPIPDPDINLLIPQAKPVLYQNTIPEEEFVLTGIIISGSDKAALIRRTTTTPSGKQREEDILFNIGDSLQGQKITDITGNRVVLNNGENTLILSGFENANFDLNDDVEDTATENEVSDITTNNVQDEYISSEYPEIVSKENPTAPVDTIEKILPEEPIVNPDIKENRVVTSNNIESSSVDSFIDEEVVSENFISHEIESEKAMPADTETDLTETVSDDFAESSDNIVTVDNLALNADTNFDSPAPAPDLIE